MANKTNEPKSQTNGKAKEEQAQDYWSYVKRQFRKNKRALYSSYVVLFLAFIALFADFLANEKPIVAQYQGSWHFPVIKGYMVDMGVANWEKEFQNVEWAKMHDKFDFAIWAPVPFLPSNLDHDAIFIGPFHDQSKLPSRHILGTDDLGRDVFAGMIHGTRIAFMVGIISMSIAFVIGLFFGAMSGFFGDSDLLASRASIIFNLFAIPLGFFYGFYARSYTLGDSFEGGIPGFMWEFGKGILIFLAIMLLANLIAYPFKRLPWLKKRVAVPVDILVTRFIEVVVSIPVLVLILAVVAILEPSIFNVMAVIGLVSWTGIARFIRAELLRVRRLEYIEAANALGFSKVRTMLRHAVPNALSPVFIAVAFGIAAAILVESFLSFLGIGVPSETITWGKLLAIARTNSAAWWLAVFPGFAIFITVTMFNLIGEGLTDALDPRLKQ